MPRRHLYPRVQGTFPMSTGKSTLPLGTGRPQNSELRDGETTWVTGNNGKVGLFRFLPLFLRPVFPTYWGHSDRMYLI